MKDKEFLEWLIDRLVHVYGESPNVDFIHRLRSMTNTIHPEVAVWAIQWDGIPIIDSEYCFPSETEARNYLLKCSKSKGTIVPLYRLENKQ